MSLLIYRDPLHLVETKGKVEAVKKLPDFLAKNPLVAHSSYIHDEREWEFIHELFIKESTRVNTYYEVILKKDEDPFVSPFKHKFVHNFPVEGIPALWSGWRSCIVKDPETQQMYRLKGITFRNPPKIEIGKDYVIVEGGAKERSAENERIYSNRFNKFLQEEGIEPAMEYVGKYVHPIKVFGEKLTTSIIKTRGDTRLDELSDVLELNVWALEDKAINSKNIYYIAKDIYQIRRKVDQLYFDLGFIVGRMKRLMTKINMTWSDNLERINHHLGNVVVYPSEEYLCLGFVDFESACNGRDMGKKRIRKQQSEEFIDMKKDQAIRGACARPLLIFEKENFWDCFTHNILYSEKKPLSEGFVKGYHSRAKKLTNKIEYHRLEEVVSLLHQSNVLLSN
jgi:hypothetical protein